MSLSLPGLIGDQFTRSAMKCAKGRTSGSMPLRDLSAPG